MIAPARRAAFEVVRRTFDDDAYADRALASAVATLDARDRALAQRLAFGTVQRVRVLDFGIEQLGKRPVSKLDPPVKASLRLGAYQLAFTDQPQHAVVDDAVELVREAGRERAVPFTNAVMRRLAGGLRGLVASLPAGPLKESYPDWIAEVWTRDLGAETALELMRAQNEPPALEVRSPSPVGTPTDVPGAYTVDRVDPRRMRPMSRASQLAALVVGAREGERVLDACAAPGGKSSILAERANVIAVEIHPGRAAALAKQRLPRVEVVNADVRELAAGGSTARWSMRRAPGSECSHDGPTCAGARSRCPSCRVSCSRPPGSESSRAASSSTPSARLNADENEAVVDASGLEIVPFVEWPQYAHPRRPEFLLTLPTRDHTSGFFIARLRRPF